MKSKDIPIGATWEAVSENKKGVIWLIKRTIFSNKRLFENWRWSVFYIDHDNKHHYINGDCNATYRHCRLELQDYHPEFFDIRFKRVK